MPASDETTLSIEVLELDESGLESLQSHVYDENTRWYYERRREALIATGLLAAAFDALHPRGRDGRFIEKFGFVRWMSDGKWKRGQVTGFDEKGAISVRSNTGEEHKFPPSYARQYVYSLPKPKATLTLPDPKVNKPTPGFTKIGGQGGSNPGGMFEVTDYVDGKPAFTSTVAKNAYTQLRNEPGGAEKYKMTFLDFDINETPGEIRSYFKKNGVLFDDSSNKAYIITDAGSIMDPTTSVVVSPETVFGTPGSQRRLDALEHFYIAHNMDTEAIGRFRDTMRSLVQQKPRTGDKFYVKSTKSEDHAKNEALANMLYEMGGVPVPDVSIGDDKITVASQIVAGDEVVALGAYVGNPTDPVMQRIREDMVFDAWLANWDVAGKTYDNVLVVDGIPYRIDAGGSLSYRAQGTAKGKMFGDKVGELETLTDSHINPQAAQVYGKVTQGELMVGAQRLAAISPQDIRMAVAEHDLPDSMADTLIARRADILEQVGVQAPDPHIDVKVEPAPPPQAEELVTLMPGETQYPDDVTGMIWNSALKNFIKGSTDMHWGNGLKYYVDNLKDNGALFEHPSDGELLQANAKGEKHYAFIDSQLYEVTAKYDPSKDDVDLTYTHVVTGDKRAVTSVGITEVLKPAEVANVLLDWRGHYARRETRLISQFDKTTEADMALNVINQNDFGISTIPWKGGADFNDVKPGDWLYDRVNAKFFRVDSMSPNLVTGTQIDGSSYTSNLNNPLQFRRRAPGSAMDGVLDSMRARDIITKKGAAYDAYTGTSPTATPGDLKIQATIADKPNVVNDLPPVTAPPDFDWTATGIGPVDLESMNPAISVVGEPAPVGTMTVDEAKEWIGKTIYLQLTENPTTNSPQARGVFTVTDVTEMPYYGQDPYPALHVKDAVGNHRIVSKAGHGSKMEIVEVDSQLAPITQFQLKTDGTVMANGEKVGEWEKLNWGYRIGIAADHTVTGQQFAVNVNNKSGLKEVAIPMIAPQGSAQAKPKSAGSVSLEKKIRQADIKFGAPHQTGAGGEAVTLLDGAHIEKDMWVVSKTDGSVGQVTETNTSYLGYVNVKYPDGKTKIRSAKTLSASVDPDAKVKPAPAPMYKDVKLSDGSPALPGQQVLDGSSPLVIIQLKADGNASVMHADGKKTWTKASKLTPAVPDAVDDPEETAGGAIAKLDESWKTAPKAKKIPYAAPGGVTIPQASDAVETYRKYATTRKLMKDNFVPQIGLRVRDTKGNQGVITRIAATNSSNPSAVWVQFDGGGAPVVKQPSTLWTDHAATLATADGKPLPTLSTIYFQSNDQSASLPTGTVILKAKKKEYLGGRYKDIDKYFAALPDGSVRQVTGLSAGTAVGKNDLMGWYNPGTLERVAYVDETSDGMMTIESPGGNFVSSAYVHSKDPGALEDVKAEVVAQQLAKGVVELEKFPGSSSQLIRLPKPTAFVDTKTAAPTGPKPYAAKGDGKVLKGPPAVSGSYSIETGIDELRSRRGSGQANQSVLYAMGDSDYVEDQAMRLQMTIDSDTKKEMIEVRINLLEEQADALGERLIMNLGNKGPGDWTTAETKMPQDLKIGDPISVRISSGVGALKPGDSSFPNATIAGAPVHVGESKAGLPLYRVDVAMASGAIGHLLLEARATPTMKTYKWDPNKIQNTGTFNGSINNDAASMGWSVRNQNAIGYESTSDHSGSTLIDDQGRKVIKTNESNSGLLSISSLSGAARMRYNDPSGDAYMTVQTIHPQSHDRMDDWDYRSGNKGLRATVNGEVIIRVPADDPNALEKISSMMSAAGIPPEKQGQPSADDLTKMAMNKVYKQFAPGYKHLDRADVGGSNDAAGIAKVLGRIDAAVGPELGRPATLDDIHIRVMPDGRITTVLSDDVANAIVKHGNFTHAYHSFTGGGWRPEMISSKATPGLLSTDERWSAGILTGGMSSTTDVRNDAGNRIYFRLSEKKSGSIGQQGQMVISAQAVAKTTDWYWNPGDRYGKRFSQNQGKALNETYFAAGSNEIMIKKKIDPAMMGFVFFGSEAARQKAIKDIHAQGVTHVEGRPIEEILVTSATVADVDGLGMHVGTEIPLTALV